MFNIVIDGGHGGTESGAIAIDGKKEKVINFNVASILHDGLKKYPWISVDMTRWGDDNPSFARRKLTANKDTDIFVSIHHNANNGKISGTEIYGNVGLATDGYNNIFTQMVGEELTNYGKYKIVYRKSDINPNDNYYAILRDNPSKYSIISEYCYLDNESDYGNIKNNYLEKEEAQKLEKAFVKFAKFVMNCILFKNCNTKILTSDLYNDDKFWIDVVKLWRK